VKDCSFCEEITNMADAPHSTPFAATARKRATGKNVV